jgi:hypothetical protein
MLEAGDEADLGNCVSTEKGESEWIVSASELYVFTVTPTSITPAPGSPYKRASPNGLFVVPK